VYYIFVSGIVIFSLNINNKTLCNGGDSYPISILYWILIISLHKLTQTCIGTLLVFIRPKTSVGTGYILINSIIELGLVIIGQVCFSNYVKTCYEMNPFSIFACIAIIYGYLTVGSSVQCLIMVHCCNCDDNTSGTL